MTHTVSSDKDECRDRAKLRFAREIADGDEYNREFVFVANEDGIQMDDAALTIPWDWILEAYRVVGTSSDPQKT